MWRFLVVKSTEKSPSDGVRSSEIRYVARNAANQLIWNGFQATSRDISNSETSSEFEMSEDGFGERLKTLYGPREKAAFARKAGIPNSTLNEYENGREPKVSNVIAIARASGVSYRWLLTGEGPRYEGAPPADDEQAHNLAGSAAEPVTARTPDAQSEVEINKDVLFTVISELEQWLAVNNKLMRPDTKARWIATAYILCMRVKSRARNQGAEPEDAREVLSPLLDLVE